MAGVTDRPFRQLCKQLGAGYAVSEMAASNPRLWASEKTSRRTDHEGEMEPKAVQIAGADPHELADCAQIQRRARRPDHRHQHGLPGEEGVQQLVRLGAAAARRPGRAHPRGRRECGRRAGDAENPHRLGPQNKNALRIARMAEQAGIADADPARPHPRLRLQG